MILARALFVLFALLWLVLVGWDVAQRRGTGSRIGAAILWFWMGTTVIGVFGPVLDHISAVGPVLAVFGFVLVMLALPGVRDPANLRRRSAFYFALGSAAGTVSMLIAMAIVGPTVDVSVRHAGSAIWLLFLDAAVGAPLVVAALDRTVSRGMVARWLVGMARGEAQPTSTHASSTTILPRATLRFLVARRRAHEVRTTLESMTVPLGSAHPTAAPRYRGVVPAEGRFALTHYVRTQRNRIDPFTFDLETAEHGGDTEVVLHAREGATYGFAAFEGAIFVGIGLAATWKALLHGGVGRERAIVALEVSMGIGAAIGLLISLLIHAQIRSLLLAECHALAGATGGTIPAHRPSVIAAIARLLIAFLAVGFALLVVSVTLLMIGIGLSKGNHEIAAIGALCAVVYGLILWAIARAMRSYLRGGLQRDWSLLTGVQTL